MPCSHSVRLQVLGLEARVGIEPTNAAFAEPCLTTWLPRRPWAQTIWMDALPASESSQGIPRVATSREGTDLLRFFLVVVPLASGISVLLPGKRDALWIETTLHAQPLAPKNWSVLSLKPKSRGSVRRGRCRGACGPGLRACANRVPADAAPWRECRSRSGDRRRSESRSRRSRRRSCRP